MAPMASITIGKLDDTVKSWLRIRAASNGRSMAEEARVTLRDAVGRKPAPSKGLGTALHELFRPFGGVGLQPLPREPKREPPTFE